MRERLQSLTMIMLTLTCVSGVSFGDEILRDPTRPYVAGEGGVAATPRFVVNAIIVSTARRVAIVNGRRVGVGATVDGATVIAIEKHQLVLEMDGERITAGLNNGASRR